MKRAKRPKSSRLRGGLSTLFFLLSALYTLWEMRLLWQNFILAVRGAKGRKF